MYPHNPQSGGSLLDRWNSLTRNQQLVVGVIGAILILSFLQGGNLFSPQRLTAAAMIVFIAFPVHEYAHAAMAVRLGDDTPRRQGRLTLNPAAHIDPIGAVLLFLTMFGWARPVQWNPRNVDIDPRTASILVALAGPVSNLLLAIVAIILWSAFFPANQFLSGIVNFFVIINVLLFVFNMIPVPPLDGSHILFALMPGDTSQLRAAFGQYGFLILMVIIFIAGDIIRVPTFAIVGLLVDLFA